MLLGSEGSSARLNEPFGNGARIGGCGGAGRSHLRDTKGKSRTEPPMTSLFSFIARIFHLDDNNFEPRAILLLEH